METRDKNRQFFQESIVTLEESKMKENDESIKSVFGWDDFVTNCDYPYYAGLQEFLKKVIGKCDENTAIVFVSRRAFCVFLLMKKMGALDGIQIEDKSIYTDRYFMKLLDQSQFTKEKVLLVDDSIITSTHMEKAIHLLKYRIGNKTILPCVFIGEDRRENTVCGLTIDIHYKSSLNDIFRLSSMETLLFNQCGIPYMVELPLMEESLEKGSVHSKFEITLDEEAYNDLRALDDEEWRYQETQMTAYLQNQITSACLIMKNEMLKQRFPELIQNMVVRIQVAEVGEKTRIVCMPFAILKSVEFDTLYQFAEIIFGGTTYWESILRAKEKCDDFEERSYISLYRTVVYSLSYYIGLEFQDMMRQRYQENIVFSQTLNPYIFDPDFTNSIKDIFDNKTGFQFAIRILLHPTSKIIEIRRDRSKIYEEISISEFSFERLRDNLLELKDELNDHFSGKTQDLEITIEELERFFENHFFVMNGNQDDHLSTAITNLLPQGFFVNALYYDKNSRIIYRGFSFGENSEIFYSVEAKVFYAAIKKYYDRIAQKYKGHIEEEYGKHYRHFVSEIYHFFTNASLIGTFITEEQFNFFVRYFQKDATRRIVGKEFLLDEHTKPYHIQMIEGYVEKLDL